MSSRTSTDPVAPTSHNPVLPVPDSGRSPSTALTRTANYPQSSTGTGTYNSTSIPTGEVNRLTGDVSKLIEERIPSILESTLQRALDLQNQIHSLQYSIELKRQEYQREVDELKREKSSLLNTIQFVQNENEKLRSHIIETGNELNPIHDEDFYYQSFESIIGTIELWAAPLSDAMPKTGSGPKPVWNTVSNLGFPWKDPSGPVVDFATFKTWYSHGTTRVQLIRHIIAVFLYMNIFRRFIFGLQLEVDDILRKVADDIIWSPRDQRQFSRKLIFRQALCEGAIRYAEAAVLANKTNLTTKLSTVLGALLYHVPPEDIQSFALRIVSEAVDLKVKLSKEHAVYSCFLATNGDQFNEARMDASLGYGQSDSSGRRSGKVSICLFPGLERSAAENRKDTVVVVKASTALESSKNWMGRSE